MIGAVYHRFGQGISVAGCAITTIITLGWMMDDVHKTETKQIRKRYEDQIKVLNYEIHQLKLDKAVVKMNYSN